MKENFSAETLRGLFLELSTKEKTQFYNYCASMFRMNRNTLAHKMAKLTEFKYIELVVLIPAIQNREEWSKY